MKKAALYIVMSHGFIQSSSVVIVVDIVLIIICTLRAIEYAKLKSKAKNSHTNNEDHHTISYSMREYVFGDHGNKYQYIYILSARLLNTIYMCILVFSWIYNELTKMIN